MVKPRLASIYIYEKMDRVWVDAKFKKGAIESPIEMTNVKFSLSIDDPKDIPEIEEYAIAKAEKFSKKLLDLMNDLTMSQREPRR